MFRKNVETTSNPHRHKMNRQRDGKIFSQTADSTHRINTMSGTGLPKRGGIRL